MDQYVLVRVRLPFVRRDLAFAIELLDVRMIGGASDQRLAAKMIEAAVTDVYPVGPVLLQKHRDHRAVGLLFAGIGRQCDDQMRFVDDAGQQFSRRILPRAETLEYLLCGRNHLLGGHRPASVAPHAVGNDGEHDAWL